MSDSGQLSLEWTRILLVSGSIGTVLSCKPHPPILPWVKRKASAVPASNIKRSLQKLPPSSLSQLSNGDMDDFVEISAAEFRAAERKHYLLTCRQKLYMKFSVTCSQRNSDKTLTASQFPNGGTSLPASPRPTSQQGQLDYRRL